MITVDRGVALTVLEFAKDNFAGTSTKIDAEIATAEVELAEGDIDRAAEDIPKALHHYEQAWHHATLALQSAGFFDLPDLDLEKKVDDLTPMVGDTINYTITANNVGPLDLTNIVIEDILPSGVTHVLNTTSAGTYNSAGLWSGFGLLTGESATLVIEVTVDAGTSGDIITNTVNYTSSSPVDTFPDSETVAIIVQ